MYSVEETGQGFETIELLNYFEPTRNFATLSISKYLYLGLARSSVYIYKQQTSPKEKTIIFLFNRILAHLALFAPVNF
jgi:isoleucyl-tRNA synthetase